jgi:hypothetical protein
LINIIDELNNKVGLLRKEYDKTNNLNTSVMKQLEILSAEKEQVTLEKEQNLKNITSFVVTNVTESSKRQSKSVADRKRSSMNFKPEPKKNSLSNARQLRVGLKMDDLKYFEVKRTSDTFRFIPKYLKLKLE